MKLYPKLFLTHLLVSLVVLVVVLVVAEVSAPFFYQEHIQDMMHSVPEQGDQMRAELEEGFRNTLTSAILLALPVAVLMGLVTTHFVMRRVVKSVQKLSEGSQAISSGHYHERLQVQGNDELSLLARNFNRMAQTLEDVERTRIEMITHVAHDLRTPLSALKGYSEGLQDGVLDKDEVASHILTEVRGMERLVQDLSLVSRVEAGKIELQMKPVQVSGVLDDLQERFRAAFEDKGVALQVTSQEGLQVHADQERLSQVLNNLLSNALRHTPTGGTVTVKAEKQGKQVLFKVQDTGIGIPPEHLGRIFDRFYRIDAHRNRHDGGSGVGLTIVKGLTELMGGTVQVESQPGQTCFVVQLQQETP